MTIEKWPCIWYYIDNETRQQEAITYRQLKMFIVFDCQGVPYLKTWNEVEADTIPAQIGGYYVESGAY